MSDQPKMPNPSQTPDYRKESQTVLGIVFEMGFIISLPLLLLFWNSVSASSYGYLVLSALCGYAGKAQSSCKTRKIKRQFQSER